MCKHSNYVLEIKKFSDNGSKDLACLINKFQFMFRNDEVWFPHGETAQPAQKRFKNVASTLVFTLCERFWNVIFGKFI